MGLSSPEMGRAHAPPYEEEAVATAEHLQASSLPTGSRGRLAQASGKLMGKALAVPKFTLPPRPPPGSLEEGENGMAGGKVQLVRGPTIKPNLPSISQHLGWQRMLSKI